MVFYVLWMKWPVFFLALEFVNSCNYKGHIFLKPSCKWHLGKVLRDMLKLSRQLRGNSKRCNTHYVLTAMSTFLSHNLLNTIPCPRLVLDWTEKFNTVRFYLDILKAHGFQRELFLSFVAINLHNHRIEVTFFRSDPGRLPLWWIQLSIPWGIFDNEQQNRIRDLKKLKFSCSVPSFSKSSSKHSLQIKDLTVASVLETTSKTRQTNVLLYRNESDSYKFKQMTYAKKCRFV